MLYSEKTMKRICRATLLLLAAIMLCGKVSAQTAIRAEARLDSTRMLIGDQTGLHLTITGSKLPSMLLPQPCDTCLTGLEIIKRMPADTQRNGNGTIISQQWILTGFDSGQFVIPPFAIYGADSSLLAETEPLLLEINTIPVDTNLAIKDIKAPLQAPLTWKEIGFFIGIGAAVLALLAGIIYLIYRLSRKKRQPTGGKREKPDEPAHIIALRALEELRLKKLWQEGRHKEYYSELSDILRNYMYNRWDIPAMEMVSDEVLEALEQLHTEKSLLNQLRTSLRTADSVKFAKACPLPDENSQAFQAVYDFVTATKAEDKPVEKEGGKANA